jgi:hypothetical protein
MLKDALPELAKEFMWSTSDEFVSHSQVQRQNDTFNSGSVCIQYAAVLLGEGRDHNLNDGKELRSWIASTLETARDAELKKKKGGPSIRSDGDETSETRF